jgi:hypothetical protein
MTPLIDAALRQYPFRQPHAGESADAYREALIRHVQKHDYAAAHEIRVGRPQAEWTPAEVQEFRDRIWTAGGPTDTFTPGVHVFPHVREEPGSWKATDAELLDLAKRALKVSMRKREKQPTAPVPIFLSVVLTTGAAIHATVDSDNRLALLTTIAKTEPVFGYVLVFDAWMHRVDLENGRAVKQDCFMAQIGSRDGLRIMQRRPYRVVSDTYVVFETPPPDVNVREHDGECEDPYASVFVSVPLTPEARPS